MSHATALLALQLADDELARLRARIEAIDARLAHNEALEEARAAVADREAELRELRRRQREEEARIADLNAKIVPEERRLYDGSVRSPKELESIAREVESLKAQRGRHEDALLDVLAQVEEAEGRLEEARRELAAREREWEAESAALRQERTALEAALDRTAAERERRLPAVPPQLVALYEELRRRKGGMAVARIQAGTCTACHVTVPDAVRRAARAPEGVARCPNCERILVVG
ncbi:Chromosome partition protein Smc [bacterium HR29]|jgi:predicted  nucleic acid-binding Zn-ribbon protein|nr:Chromosome partition protein Smc [bacterium HR29]